MADLTNIFGGPWSPPTTKVLLPPEDQLRDAISNAGMIAPNDIFLDGKIHRFRSGTKGVGGFGDKTGWYIAFNDGIPAGRFGCWRAGIEQHFRADIGRKLTDAEEIVNARRLREAQVLRDADIQRRHQIATLNVEKIWSSCTYADPEHPYLKRKGIGLHGARVTGDGRLSLPLFDRDGNITSLQYIDNDGGKLYHPGGQTSQCFWMLGTMDEEGTLYIAEGFATAATIYEATQRPCAIAYSASNLVPVTGILRDIYGPRQDIVIVADNDASGVGQKYADQASAKHGARVVMPPVLGDANDYQQAGHDLSSLLNPPVSEFLIKDKDFNAKPAPISWLVKHWLQSSALIMVHGPSGGGKTFFVLDVCKHIASSKAEWNGQKVRGGSVVYLAGEGHHGLRGRSAAWDFKNKPHNDVELWFSKHGCDLNIASGYNLVVEHIRALPTVPSLIVVDTLHRFLNGDENSAQDAKTMLDACASLMKEFDCSVLLVHHTGVSEEAQHRARGSSAWKGALDIEISVIPPKDGHAGQIVQRKSKDAEQADDIFFELESVTIPKWFDEDGEPVTSAVFVTASAPPPKAKKKDSKYDAFRKMHERYWWETGAQEHEGMPYISRKDLSVKLKEDGFAPRTIRNHMNAGQVNGMINVLINGGYLTQTTMGFVVSNEVAASVLLMKKNSERGDSD